MFPLKKLAREGLKIISNQMVRNLDQKIILIYLNNIYQIICKLMVRT